MPEAGSEQRHQILDFRCFPPCRSRRHLLRSFCRLAGLRHPGDDRGEQAVAYHHTEVRDGAFHGGAPIWGGETVCAGGRDSSFQRKPLQPALKEDYVRYWGRSDRRCGCAYRIRAIEQYRGVWTTTMRRSISCGAKAGRLIHLVYPASRTDVASDIHRHQIAFLLRQATLYQRNNFNAFQSSDIELY